MSLLRRESDRSRHAGDPSSYVEKERLVCYGCAHSAADAPWPSAPSGERPCQFCIRNPFLDLVTTHANRTWYDGTEPVRVPMDAYQTMDMRSQVQVWIKNATAPTPDEKRETAEALLAMREVATA